MPDRNLPVLAAFFTKAQRPLFSCIAVVREPQLCHRADARVRVGENPEDGTIAQLTEEDTEEEQDHLNRHWSGIEAIIGAEKRLALIAKDLVRHFEARLDALDGKGMIVCINRAVCVAFYKEIIKLRPGWHSDDEEKGCLSRS